MLKTFTAILIFIEILTCLAILFTLPAVLIGTGILMIAFDVYFIKMNTSVISAIQKNISLTPKTIRRYIISTLLTALGNGYGAYLLATLGNIDTTGNANDKQFYGGLIVDVCITFTVLYITWAWQRNKHQLIKK